MITYTFELSGLEQFGLAAADTAEQESWSRRFARQPSSVVPKCIGIAWRSFRTRQPTSLRADRVVHTKHPGELAIRGVV